jgi:FkbM family methyltransferase
MMSESPSMNYSQRDEQQSILGVVDTLPDAGRFLDIGAWHARDLSNTRALYERGWSGMLIEPSPEPFLGLLKEYGEDPRVTLICAAVGFERTMTRFYATADALSTSSEENYAKWKHCGGFYGSFYIPVITIDEILNQFGAFDFVNIDAEGTSVDLFHALLATAMRPRCVCVEHDDRIVECSARAQAAGYKPVYVTGENMVFAL